MMSYDDLEQQLSMQSNIQDNTERVLADQGWIKNKDSDQNQSHLSLQEQFFQSIRKNIVSTDDRQSDHYALDKLFMQNSAIINTLNAEGELPITYALKLAEKPMAAIYFLIDNANLNLQNAHGEIALIVALRHNIDVFHLLKKEADLTTTDKFGNSVWHVAVFTKQYNILTDLVDPKQTKNIKINLQNNRGDTPLHIAAAQDDLKALEILNRNNLLDKNFFNKAGQTAFHVAVINGYVDVVTYFKERLSYNINQRSKVILETKNDDGSIRQQSIEDATPLMLAVQYKQINILHKLIEYRANLDLVNNDGKDVLTLAREQLVAERFIHALTAAHSQRNVDNRMESSNLSNISDKVDNPELDLYAQCINSTLMQKRDIFSFTGEGTTYPHLALAQGYLGLINIFNHIHHMPKNLSDSNGNTLLHTAIMGKDYLVQINSQKTSKMVPAIRYNDIFNYLVAQNYDLYTANNDGELPIHTASKYGYIVPIKAMFMHDNNILYLADKTVYNKLPIHYMAINNQQKLIEMVRSEMNFSLDGVDKNRLNAADYVNSKLRIGDSEQDLKDILVYLINNNVYPGGGMSGSGMFAVGESSGVDQVDVLG